MSCSENTLLKGVKDKQKELDTLLEQGKDGLASMQGKVNELKATISLMNKAFTKITKKYPVRTQ